MLLLLFLLCHHVVCSTAGLGNQNKVHIFCSKLFHGLSSYPNRWLSHIVAQGCLAAATLQASYDPNAVAAVLAQFPYHVDSLLAMNELYRSMGEAQVSLL
jgi:hypothetical protein